MRTASDLLRIPWLTSRSSKILTVLAGRLPACHSLCQPATVCASLSVISVTFCNSVFDYNGGRVRRSPKLKGKLFLDRIIMESKKKQIMWSLCGVIGVYWVSRDLNLIVAQETLCLIWEHVCLSFPGQGAPN